VSCSIGIVPYINMRAYSLVPPPADCKLIQLPPKQMIQAFKSGTLAAAAVPIGGLYELKGKYSFLSTFGISARGRIDSVLLFSKRPFNQLSSGCSITLSGESATSNRLLKLLLGYELGFDNLPRFTPPGKQTDAELVIGDAALQRLHHASAPYVIDLAQLWQERHGLPFVFARWIIRSNASTALKQSLSEWLESVSASQDQWLPQVAQEAAAQLGISTEASEAYLHRVHYNINMPEQQGQILFQQELKQHGLLSLSSSPPILNKALRSTGS